MGGGIIQTKLGTKKNDDGTNSSKLRDAKRIFCTFFEKANKWFEYKNLALLIYGHTMMPDIRK
ncbi:MULTISPECIES: hypothetical protein [Bacillus]|jgi:hypothetical protein|uniref:hypothetical protein n=1 Tax=Bacillus TaxID=1386 RepID=UPI0002F799E2|nr:hypothetical protein [Bacillus smithii]